MRAPVLCASIVLVAVSSAAAQETQQEIADRIVREQEELRARSVGQALGAPGRAFDRLDAAAHSVGETPAAAPPAAASADAPAPRKFPWGWLVGGAVVVGAVLGFRAAWRRAGDGRR